MAGEGNLCGRRSETVGEAAGQPAQCYTQRYTDYRGHSKKNRLKIEWIYMELKTNVPTFFDRDES